ncbi:hypothetical protein EKO27_g5356 [Xylaria grammica]|uniref:Uncharacterized protein n=1 Tax=Xylaria grammica TaxID=363999 RepID=A0A439D5T6_9PEZI|nr:hypothetical protein EKO27_g5356 [Xylaria grammica]
MDFSKLPTDFFLTSLQYTKNVHSDQYPAVDPTREDLSLAGKVVIVTGASRGLGAKAFAPAFAKAGARGLVLVATNAEALKNVEREVKKINAEIETLAISADISDGQAVTSAFERIKATFGHADILINNAGINRDGEGVVLSQADPETWWRQFEVNGKGTFLVTHAFINQLPARDTPATIINLTTGAAWKGNPMAPGYSVSKLVTQQLVPAIAPVHPNIMAVALLGLLRAEFGFEMLDLHLLQGVVAVVWLRLWLCLGACAMGRWSWRWRWRWRYAGARRRSCIFLVLWMLGHET